MNWMKHVFSMNFTHFHENILQQGRFNCNRPNGPKYANTEKQDWTELSLRNNIYNAKVNIGTRLEHGFAIEYTYFQ